MPKSRESKEIKLPVVAEKKERMGEEGEEKKKIEKLFKMFINRTKREGIHEGKNYLTATYISLTEKERKIMNDCIIKSQEMEIAGVPKEKITAAKKNTIKRFGE